MKILLWSMVFSFLFSQSTTVFAQDMELSVVGNAQSVPEEMDMNLLKSVFRGEKLRWDDGSPIKIALMKTNTPIGTSTCKKVYNMTGNELNKYFLALVFQGKVKAPTFFNSAEDLENYVSDTPGAIGVVQDIHDDQLKIVLVNGKKQI